MNSIYLEDKSYILKNEISSPINIDLSSINFSTEDDFKQAKEQKEILEFNTVIKSELDEVEKKCQQFRLEMEGINQKIEEIKRKVNEEEKRIK